MLATNDPSVSSPSPFSRRRYTGILVTLLALAFPQANPASADTCNYRVSLKGTSTTLSGQRIQYTGSGTTINGTGLGGLGRSLFGNITFTQNSTGDIGLITGKASRDRLSFSSKFTKGIPDRLDPAAGASASTVGTISGQQQ